MAETIKWTFYGYVTPNRRKDVQGWFDALSPEARDEARDVLAYLQHQPRHLWCRPEFDVLDHDTSEIRFKVNVLHEQRVYRIYGAFWPERKRYSFTFLLGKDKKVDNDRNGKKEAIDRLRRLRRGEATIHEFEF
jgi:hypothetical protein